MGKRKLVALLVLSSWYLVIVVWLFLMVSWVCLQFMIVVFPDHIYNFLTFSTFMRRELCHVYSYYKAFCVEYTLLLLAHIFI